VATSRRDGNGLLLWDLRHRGQARQLRLRSPHRYRFAAVGFLSEKRVAGVFDEQVAVWNVQTARLIPGRRVLPRDASLATRMEMSRRGDVAYVTASGRLTLVRALGSARFERARYLTSGAFAIDYVTDISFSPDGRFLGAITPDGVLRIWNVATRARFLRVLDTAGRAAESLRLGSRPWHVAVGWRDGTVDAWQDIRSDSVLLKKVFEAQLGGRGGVTNVVTLHGHASAVTSLALSANGDRLVTSSDDGVVELWSPSRSQMLTSLPVSTDFPTVSDVAVGGRTVAATTPGHVEVWTTPQRPSEQMRIGSGGGSPLVAVSRDGRSVAVAADGRILLLDSQMKREPEDVARTAGRVYALVFGQRVLAWSTAKGFTIWSTERHRMIKSVKASSALALALSPDEEMLAVTGVKGTTLYNTRGDRVGSLGTDTGPVAFGHGDIVATTSESDHGISLWDARRRARIGGTLSTGDDDPTALAFSPDAKTLAASVRRHAVIGYALLLWDVPSGKELGKPFEGLGGEGGLGFSGDARFLALEGDDSGVALLQRIAWGDIPAMQSRLCEVAGRNLTAGEWNEFVGSGRPDRTCLQWPSG
jgi:WD40 repeat protein